MRRSILVNPVLFCVRHIFAPRHLACRSGPVKGAAFRAVAEGFEPVTFLGRIPMVDDHLQRHTATPDASRAFGVIGSGV